jgi:hypothetical protein
LVCEAAREVKTEGARSRTTSTKRQREAAKRERKRKKEERRAQRAAAKEGTEPADAASPELKQASAEPAQGETPNET